MVIKTRSKEVPKTDNEEKEDDFELIRIDKGNLKFSDGTETKVFKYSSKSKKSYLDIDDVGVLYNELKDVFDNGKIQIKGLADKWITLSNFNSKIILSGDDMDDYFQGRVDDTTKFKSFSQLIISVGG